MAESREGSANPEVSLYGGTNSIHEGPTLMIYLPPEAPLPNNITLEVRISSYEFWEDQTFHL